jgi:organic hydroperoxide reductase OsmC/OhrA
MILTMHPYPHVYRVSASAEQTGSVTLASSGLPSIETAPPPEFDGPGNLWSPETLLCAAAADCFILTFRGISRAARFEWVKLDCRVEGTLERLEGISQFTRYLTLATLTVPASADTAKARSLLERTEHTCLVTNSLRGTHDLKAEVITLT